MTDRDVAARLAAAEDRMTILLRMLVQQRVLSPQDVADIDTSVEDLQRDGVRAAPPGAGKASPEVANLLARLRAL